MTRVAFVSAAVGVCISAVMACGLNTSDPNGGEPDAAHDDGSIDGSVVDVVTADVKFNVSDVSIDSYVPTPVSSLALEQVWFLTGVIFNGNKDLLVDFRPSKSDGGAPLVTCNSQVPASTGFEGSAVFTDPSSGQLLFYTDGVNLYDGVDNQLLVNGDNISGNVSACEPALITPQLNTNGKGFYVFTVNYTDDNATTGTIYYSTIDLSQGPHGTVTAKNIPVFTGNVGEALDVVPHTNNNDFWVLTYNGGNINAFLVSASGVSPTPVVSTTGLASTVFRSAINHSYDYDHLALAISHNDNTTGLIGVAEIDRSTGVVSGVKTIATGDIGFHATYSGDGTKLYYVRGNQGFAGAACQFDLALNKETTLGMGAAGIGLAAAKLAPDGKVYFVGDGSPYLAVVNNPNASGTACNFNPQGLSLNGCLVGFGVPNQTAAYLSYLPSPN